MSKTVDERIVEMKFDNDQFEKNVNESITTIKSLKKELKFDKTSKELEELERASQRVSFKALMNSIDAVSVKMSALGVVGKTALEEITKSAMQMGSKIVNAVKEPIIQGGIKRAMNIEQARFMLQGLITEEMGGAKEVQAIMDAASKSVDGTAYSYDAAAKAAAQFAATGIRSGDQLDHTLAAIAGTTAMAGTEYERVADIFTTVSSNGKLMTMQLRQFSSMGLNVSAVLAKSMNKTEAEINEMVTKSQISFEQFANAMNDAFGEHAKKANDTFTGALSNVRAALARIGAEFVSPLVEQNGKIVEFLNTIRVKINGIKAQIVPIAKVTTEAVKNIAERLGNQIKYINVNQIFNVLKKNINVLVTLFHKLQVVLRPVKHALKDIFPKVTLYTLEKLSDKLLQLVTSIKITSKQAEELRRAWKGVFAVFDAIGYIIKTVLVTSFNTVIALVEVFAGDVFEGSASIGDMLVALRDWIKENDRLGEALRNVSYFIVGMAMNIKEFVAQFKQMPAVQKADKILKIFGKNMQKYLSGGIDVLLQFMKRTSELDGFTLENLQKAFDDFVTNVLGYFLDFDNAFDGLSEAVSDLVSSIESELLSLGLPVNEVKESAKGLVDYLKVLASKVKFENIFVAFVGLGTIKLFNDASKALLKLMGPLSGLGSVFNNTAKVIGAFQKQIEAATLVNIAIAIGVLAGSLWVMANIPSDNLWNAVKAMGALFLMLGVTSVVMSRTSRAVGAANVVPMLISMAGVLLTLGLAIKEFIETLKVIDDLRSKDFNFEKNIATLNKVIGALGKAFAGALVLSVIAVRLTRTLNPLVFVSLASVLVALGGALYLTSLALKELKDIKLENFDGLITTLATLLAGMAAVSFGARGLTTGAFLPLLAIPASLWLMVKAFEKINELDVRKTRDNIENFIYVFGAIGLLLAATRIGGANAAKAGLGILAMSASLYLMIGAVVILGQLDKATIQRGSEALAGLFFIMGVTVSLAHFAGQYADKSAKMIAMMGLALIECTICIALLSLMDASGVERGVAAIQKLIFAFGVAVALTGFAKDFSAVRGTLLSMIAIVTLLSLAIVAMIALSTDDGNDAMKAAGAIAIALGAVTVCLFAITNLVKKPIDKEVGKSLAGIILAFGLIGGIFMAMSMVGVKGDDAWQYAKSISLSLGTIGIIMAILSGLHANAATGAQAALALVAFIGVLGGVFGAIGAIINAIPGGKEAVIGSLDTIIEINEKIGECIGAIVGGFIGNIVDSAMKKIADAGVYLSNFMKAAQPFFDGIKGVNSQTLRVMSSLFSALADMGKLNKKGGLAQLFTGSVDYTNFGEGMSAIAEGLAKFIEAIDANGGLDDGKVERITLATKALRAIAEMAQDIPNTGGLIAEFVGDNDPAQWGGKIAYLARGLVWFLSVLDGGDAPGIKGSGTGLPANAYDTVQNACKCLYAISEMARDIPNTGGLIAEFIGDNDPQTWGSKLEALAQSLVNYAGLVDNLTPTQEKAMDTAYNCMKKLAELGQMMTINTGLKKWLQGDNNFANFGSALEDFADSMRIYSEKLSSVKWYDVRIANSELTDLATAFQTLSGVSVEVSNIKDLSKSITKISKPMTEVGKSFKEFNEYTVDVDFNRVFDGMDNVGKIVDALDKITVANIDPNSVGLFTDALRELGAADYGAFLETFTGNYEEAFDVGRTFASNIYMGIDQEMISATDNVKKSVSNMIEAIKQRYTDFHSVGGYLMRGLAQGIKDNADIPRKEAEKIGNQVVNATKKATEVKSPSRAFMRIGKFLDMGLAKGISDNAKIAIKASTALAVATDDAYRDYMGIHSPSTRGEYNGEMYVEGNIKGAKKKKKKLENTMEGIAKDSNEAFANTFSGNGSDEGLLDKIVNKAKEGVKTLGDTVEKGKKKVEETLNNGGDTLDIFKVADPSGTINNITDSADAAANSVNNLANTTTNASKKIKKSGKNVKSAKDEYKEFLESIQNSLKSAGGIFEEFSKKQETSLNTMRLNLATQTAEISKWGENIRKLGERGLSKGFLKYLSELGMQGASYVEELVKSTDKELAEIQNLYSTNLSVKDEVADEIAQTWKKAGKKASIAFNKGVEEGSKKNLSKDNTKATIGKSKNVYKSDMKTVDSNSFAKEWKAVEKIAKKSKEIINYSVNDNIKSVAKTMAYGGSVLKRFGKDLMVNSNNYKLGTKAVNAAKKAISNYGKELYKKSSYYEEDQAQLKYYKDQKSEYEKHLKELENSKKKASKKEKARINKEITETKAALKVTKQAIEATNQQISEHTKAAFEETYASIKETIKEFVTTIPTEFDAGIDLFGDSELPISDQLSQANDELADLEAQQKSLMEDIRKYYLATDEASKESLVQLQKDLDSVNDKISRQKSTIESLEEAEDKYTAEKILDGMSRSVNAVSEWQSNLKKLSKTSISEGLLRELKEMGPQGAEYVKTFVNMTADELAEANNIYAKKMDMNNKQLLSNFKDKLNIAKEWGEGLEQLGLMGLDQNIIGQIQEMGIDGGLELMRQVLTMSSKDIEEFNKTYAKSLKIPDVVTNQSIAAMSYAGGLACKSFNNAMAKLYEDGTDENKAYKDNINSIQKVFDDATKDMGKKGAKNVANQLTSQLGLKKKTVKKNGSNIGKAIVDGVTKGIKDNKNALVNGANFIADIIESTTKKKLGIKSPSRVFAQIGKFVDQGFAKGVNDNANLMTNSVENAANNTIDAINEIVEKGSEQPTIRPVMDLTEIQNGVDTINSMSSDLGVDSSYNFAKQTMDSFNASTGTNYTLDAINRLQATLDNMGMRPNITENNTFNIEDATDPRAVAEEVNTILQKQLERRSAVWA